MRATGIVVAMLFLCFSIILGYFFKNSCGTLVKKKNEVTHLGPGAANSVAPDKMPQNAVTAIIILSFRTDRSRQTVQTQIRLLLAV